MSQDRPAQPTPGERHKILVVEDDSKIRQLLVDGLKSQGFQMESAGDGLEALKILDRFVPDLFIVDLNMPKLDGISFLKALKNRPETKSLPSIILTAQSDDANINQAMSLGARHFLVKPIRFKLFLNYVRSCLVS